MNGLLSTYRNHRKLNTLVENRTTYSAEYAELNIFETNVVSEKVSLTFDFPIIATMLTGRKRMHLEGKEAFDFIPGESVIMPTGKEMVIDFPIASIENPTQCLALGIDTMKISDVVETYNQSVSIENDNDNWNLDASTIHLTNNADINILVNRLVTTFTNNCVRSKDVLLDLMIQELIIRLLQTKAKSIFCNGFNDLFNDTRIGFVINYIKKNLTNKDLTVDVLAEKACMSTSHFHKKFKATLGISPIDFVNSEKIKFAKKLIKKHSGYHMSEIAFKSGFNNTSYFNRQFKKNELITTQQFKKSISLSS